MKTKQNKLNEVNSFFKNQNITWKKGWRLDVENNRFCWKWYKVINK